MIEIVVNGRPQNIPSGLTIASLLSFLALDQQRVAVEFNGGIVQQPRWSTTEVPEAAAIEIVHFVGGG